MGPNIGDIIVRYHTQMVYPKIYRPLMGTRGTFFFIFKFLPFCFQFLIRFKTYAYFWAYQFFSFFFSTQKNSSNYGSPMCRGQEKSSASTLSTTFVFFPVLSLPFLPSLPCLALPHHLLPSPCLVFYCLVLSCRVLSCLVLSCLVLRLVLSFLVLSYLNLV